MNGGILDVSTPGLLEFCGKDLAKLYDQGVAKSYKHTEQEMKVNNAPRINFSRVDMEQIGDLHNESILADQATYQANLQRINEREARLARLQNGEGTVSDLQAARNALTT